MQTHVIYAILKEDDELYIEYDADGTFKSIVYPIGQKHLYIGQTTNFTGRLKSHRDNTNNHNYTASKKLYNCMRKYGWEHFTKIIIARDILKEEVNEIEISLIAKYDSFKSGLNSSPGGEAGAGSGGDHTNSRSIRVFNISTQEERVFGGMNEAARFYQRRSSNIHAVINGINDYFSYENEIFDAQYDEKPLRQWRCIIKKQHEKKEKPVIAFYKDDPEQKVIFEFSSTTKAETATGVHNSCIGKCANHKRTYAGEHEGRKLVWRHCV